MSNYLNYKKTPFVKRYTATIGNVSSGADFYSNTNTIDVFDGFIPVVTGWYVESEQYQTWIIITSVITSFSGKNNIIINGRNSSAGTAVNVIVQCDILYVPS